MGKITYLRPRRGDVKPILMLLTSHRLDCFLVCVRCLERFTDLGRFAHVYVLAEVTGPEHLALARHFAARHGNVTVLHLPPGEARDTGTAQHELYLRHIDDVIIKLDEDIFVTPHWLEHLLDGYLEHLGRADAPLVTPLVPVSPAGRHMLGHFLRVAYPSERHMFAGPSVEENWVYHRWIWEKLLYENLADVYLRDDPRKYGYVGQASANCMILDRRVLERVLPLPLPPRATGGNADDLAINALLRSGDMKVAVLGRSLAHHYSYAGCEEYLRSHVPLDRVWRFLKGIDEAKPSLSRHRCPTGPREFTLLRAGG
jgi:hypothetical protein